MFCLAKLRPGAERYYFATVGGPSASSTGLVEPDPYWTGQGSRLLGLSGRPEASAVGALFAGADPLSGEELVARHRSSSTVAAFDLVFSAPKSVSLLQALAAPERGELLREAHERAVAKTLAYIETEVLKGRRRSGGGQHSVGVEGAVAVCFPHRTSRANDPHLHTHVLLANLGRESDGRWGALDGRQLFGAQRLLRALFDSELRSELSRLGLEFGPLRRGMGDLAGVTRETVREFSRQSIRIEQALAAAGPLDPGQQRELAALVRPPKDLSTSYEQLRHQWRQRAYEVGLSPSRLERAAAAGPSSEAPSGADHAWWERARSGPDGTTTRRELLQARACADSAGASIERVQADVEAFLRLPGIDAVGERYLLPGAAERLFASSEALVERAEGVPVFMASYEAGGRLAVLDQLSSANGSGARMLALAPGRKAAVGFETATGIASVPVAQGGRAIARSGPEVVVLTDCWSLAQSEIAEVLGACASTEASLVLFGAASALDQALLLNGLRRIARPLVEIAPKLALRVHDLPPSSGSCERVSLPSLACERAASVARELAAGDKRVLVLLPQSCMATATASILAGSGEGVRVGLLGRALPVREEAVVTVGPVERGGRELRAERSIVVQSRARGGLEGLTIREKLAGIELGPGRGPEREGRSRGGRGR